MSIGVCCHWLEEKTKPRSGKTELVNIFDERTLQLGRYRQGKYSPELIKNTYVHNVKRLAEMLPFMHKQGVQLFRISSAMFPLADQVDKTLWNNPDVEKYLSIAGDYIKKNGIRVTTHPGQFCVLSSDSEEVVAKAFVELGIHGWMFDMMITRLSMLSTFMVASRIDRLDSLSKSNHCQTTRANDSLSRTTNRPTASSTFYKSIKKREFLSSSTRTITSSTKMACRWKMPSSPRARRGRRVSNHYNTSVIPNRR